MLYVLAVLGAALPNNPPAEPVTVVVPRIDAEVEIDGVLDEPVWLQAAVLADFSQYLPVDGRPANDSTQVLVWYSPTAIYFGIRAFEQHGAVQATLADRDRITGDDHSQILLDTFNDQRQAFLFGVNPFGIQSDGILRDAARRTGSFRTQAGGAYAIDYSPDFVFESKGQVTPQGYEVEVRIPFKSLRYQAARQQNWGINIIRKVQHSGYEHTWSPVLQSDASFLAKSGTLQGLTELHRGIVLDVTPEITSNVTGAPAPRGWDYHADDPAVGGNVRWGITNNLFFNATVNPDFSQVEADVAQLQFDPRRAVFFPEKRPFFLDGIEQFDTPNRLIYTRRLANPDAAVKLTGKVAETNLALLSGVDDKTLSATGEDNPVFNLLRVRSDIGGQSTLGIAYTDKIEGDDYNRVAAADGRLVLGAYDVTFQGGASFTRTSGETAAAPIWQLNVNRAGRRFGFNSGISGLHQDFRASSGFISRVGIVHANFVPRINVFGNSGATIERWTGSITLDGTWDYDRFFDGKTPNDPKLWFGSSFVFRGGWRAGTQLLIESFSYPPELYTNYFIERTTPAGTDTIPFTGTHRLSNYDLVVNFSTPEFQTFSAGGYVIVGRDENFFEWASANVLIASVNADWRPTEQLRVNVLYNHQQYFRPSDGSVVGLRRVPRLKLEYQLSRAIFVRFVGQYDANFQDELRDNSRTEDPILIYDPSTDTFARGLEWTSNDFRVDWLFSYRPNPGTVFFAGYGSSLAEPRSFRFSRLERVSDGFFVKASYLWRL
jgi:hypothetical protein